MHFSRTIRATERNCKIKYLSSLLYLGTHVLEASKNERYKGS